MSCSEDSPSHCECRYTLTIMNEIVQEQSSEIKDSFNNVPSIHEVDEEETDEEHKCNEETKRSTDVERSTDLTKDTADEESIYSNESFCSDESCEENGEVNTTTLPRSTKEFYFSPHVNNEQSNSEETENENGGSEETRAINEIINPDRCKSSISEDCTGGTKQMRRRKNMSFTDAELRKIEWENQILLKKIMAQQKPKEKILRETRQPPRISSSAINRRKLQKKIENENMFLLQRIQQTKPRVLSSTTKPGCRQTTL